MTAQQDDPCLVVVAVNDFALRANSDDPLAPARLLLAAELIQAELIKRRPEIDAALTDLLLYGRAKVPFV